MKIQEIALRKKFEQRMRKENSWSAEKECLLNRNPEGKYISEIMEASFCGYGMCFDDLLRANPEIRDEELNNLLDYV